MDQEQISIEIDDRPAAEAIKRTNAGLESVENKSKSVVDGMGKQWAAHAETIVRISDRSKSSIDRTVASVQKLADAYGKTEVEKLLATQDQLIQRFKGEQAVVDAVTSSYGKMIAAAKEAEAAKAKAAQQSAIDSYTRQAALYQKTGVARLEAQRDIELGQYVGPEHDPVRAAIRQSYSQMIDVENANRAKAAIDAQRSSLDQLIGSLEKENALSGKTGIQRQIVERELLLKEWQHEPQAVDAITASLKRLRAQEEQESKTHGNSRRLILGAKDLAEGYSRGAVIEGVDYLMSLRGAGGAAGAAEGSAGFAGIAGLSSGAAIAIGGLAAAFGVLEIAGVKAMKSLGEVGQQIENVHLRTGLAVTEVQDFAYAAKAAGQDVGIFEKMMRGLSETVSENSREGDKARQALRSIGVSLRDDAGTLKPTGEVFRQIAEGLNRIPAGFQRDAAALDLFKRAGIEAIPVIEKLLDKLHESQEIGGTLSGDDLKLFEKFRDETEKAGEAWTRLKLRIEEPIAAKVLVQIQFVKGALRDLHDSSVASALRGLSASLPGTADANFGVLSGKMEPDQLGYFDPQTGKTTQASDLLLKDVLAKDRERRQHAEAVQQRQGIDQQIRAFTASQEKDLNFQLRQAEESLNKLPKPEVNVTTPDELTAYKAAFNRVNQLKEQIKAVQQLREEETKLEAFEKQMNEREGSYLHLPTDRAGHPLPISPGQKSNAFFDQNPTAPNAISIFAPASPVDKIFAERDDLVKHGANRDRATSAALIGASAELAKEQQDWQKTWTETVRSGNEEIDKLRKEEAKKAVEAMDEATKQWLANLQRNMAALKEIDERNFARMNAAEEHQERMIGLSAGPNDELRALHEQLAMREQIRQAQLAAMELHKGAFDLDRERFRAEMESLRDRYEFEEKILELKRQQTEEVKQAVEPLVHTLLTKPGDFGRQLGDTLHEAMLKPVERGLTNLISQSVTPFVFGSDGQGGVSGFFKNAFGGSKQYDQELLKGATDLNSMATAANTAAIISQTEMWKQQQAFHAAQEQNASARSSGQVGFTAATAPQVVTATTAVPGASALLIDSLRLGGSASPVIPAASPAITASAPQPPQGTASSVIRYFTENGTLTPGDEQVPPPSVSPLPQGVSPFPPNVSNKSPNGFATLGEIASLNLNGLFGPGGSNAYSDQNPLAAPARSVPVVPTFSEIPAPGPIVSGTDASVIPAPIIPPQFPVASQPSAASGILGTALQMFGMGARGQGQSGPFGMLQSLGLGPGGTSGFAGPLGLGGQGGGTSGFGGLFGNLGSTWGNLRNFVGLGQGGTDLGNGVGVADILHNGTTGQIFTSIGRSPGMAMAGGMLALNGLTGGNAGTLKGTLEGAAGGAMLGFKFGGPIGAAIGAGVGLGIGVGEQLAGVESPENEAKRLAKQIYGVKIDDGLARQIAAIAKQKYGNHVSMAVRAPEVRQLILLYSEATGQKMPLDSTTPRAASLVEQGGKLFQAPTYQDGTAYTFKSSLPVAGGYAIGNYPSPSSVVLNVNGQSAADLLEGRIANTVNPSYVQDQWSQSSKSSYGRLNNSAMMQQPNLIVS